MQTMSPIGLAVAASMALRHAEPSDLIMEVESLGPFLLSEIDVRPLRRSPRRRGSAIAKRKPYKGSKAAKRASRPRRKPTRSQRWAA